MVLRKSDLVRTGAGRRGRDHVLRRHGRARAARQPHHHRGDAPRIPSTKQRRVAWHISSGEVNFQTVRRNVPGSATEISTPTVTHAPRAS